MSRLLLDSHAFLGFVANDPALSGKARNASGRASSDHALRSGFSGGWVALKYDMKYAFPMERVTATLDEKTLAKIRLVAGPRGVSSFLNEAARERLARLELRGLLDDLDAKHGAAPAAVRAEIARDARRIFRARSR